MNDQKVIEHMISFIENKEKDLQAAKPIGNAKAKNQIVNDIIKELERETKDAD